MELGVIDAIVARQRRQLTIRLVIVLALAALCIATAIADVLTGPFQLSLADVFDALFEPSSLDKRILVVVQDVRLPQAATAVLVGAALAVGGVEMQTVLDNPLADPFTFGISAAASFGAAVAIVAGLTIPFVSAEWIVPANAFVFALASVLIVQAIARFRGRSTDTLVLVGIGLIFTFNAMTGMLEYVASEQALQRFVFWSMGSLTATDGTRTMLLALLVCLTMPFSFMASRALTALRFGEDRAQSFGVNVQSLRFWALFRASLLAAATVSVAGSIGFVGLVGPHVARLLIGEDHRYFLPGAALVGAIIMSASALLAKSVVPGVVLPIGIVTSLVGLPVFFALILRPNR
ncbi:FecCD family ABC transporter permease [Ensifer adhaerens]|uniref:FecCD family ABC transporter permease n=1 Tax=Ensifer adhaerens TaxID=106592 RepID=UPI003D08E187